MTPFLVGRRSRLPVGETWSRLTDWERHAAHVPLTRIVVATPSPTGVGTRFVARTGIGPVAYEDPMEVVRWEPPAGDGGAGHCRLEKRGRVVSGWAELEVTPRGAGAWVVWREDLRVERLPRLFDAPTAFGGRWLFGRVVERLLAD
ncbi:Immediate-early protein 2 [Streptomyces cinnamoneus]|uniref:Immediate-early protein 2 n=1 Tax=Streptomyces cinnamoneus TaxID=53446 RepID=A0A2G1XP36_STRCJ|nr:Immediate-early protein 2 [Streptomyces cinnamoneus]PHQ52973.1 Immediate-early protein 2 [Streptomyces cinnamoneus]PPT11513.1 Immediate-early protein 2 [Streptomyces cinnamoneus]